MNKYVFTIAIAALLLGFRLSAQYVYNKLYKPDSIVIAGIASFPDTRHIIGYYVTMDNISSFCVGEFDEWGEVNNLYSILPYTGLVFIQWGWSVLNHEDNILIVINRENFSNSVVDYDILSNSYEVMDCPFANGLMVLNSIIPTSDGGYAISGNARLNTQNFTDMLLYKVNGALEVEWYQKYGGPEIGKAFTLAEIPPASGGGFILGGYEAYSTDPDESTNRCRVYRISNDGEDISWFKDFDIPYTTGSSANVCINDDTSFFASGNTGDYQENLTMYASLCSYETGEEIIRKTYHGYIISGGFRNFGNGNIVGAYWKIHNTPEENDITHKPVLIRFNEEMDTLWTSTIYSIPEEEDYIRDVKRCPDGGYLITGFNYTRQAAWLLKTDSMGRTCLPADCDSTITAISTLPIVENPFSLVLTHNPVTDLAIFTHSIPLDSQPAKMEIYDLSGRVMMSRMIALQGGEIKLDISSLPRGVYVYRLHTGPIEWGTGKMMVSR